VKHCRILLRGLRRRFGLEAECSVSQAEHRLTTIIADSLASTHAIGFALAAESVFIRLVPKEAYFSTDATFQGYGCARRRNGCQQGREDGPGTGDQCPPLPTQALRDFL